jgi:hypothetical protein
MNGFAALDNLIINDDIIVWGDGSLTLARGAYSKALGVY